MKNTNRYIALALCFSLTLGAFAYRPSEAKAIAGVDDAVVIGALLSAFAGGCGLIFSNNGMTSGELAQGLTDKWNEFNEAAESGASSFAAWLGFEDTSALLGALSFSGSKLVIPRAIARKLAEFTTWLVDNVGVTVGNDSVLLTDAIDFSSLTWEVDSSFGRDFGYYFSYSLSSSLLRLSASKPVASDSGLWGYIKSKPASVSEAGDYTFNFSGVETHSYKASATSSPVVGFGQVLLYVQDRSSSNSFSVGTTVNAADFSHLGGKFGDAADDDIAPSPTITGVGDGTATSIEDLLQQILAQLQANTLAPTLDLAGTQTGGNTGTDEDAKPYLPYIPQIFEKIKELPGTLANIWESIKGIPAAIAEKIGAFFTTLWGWLQSIIDAITALPAAIAEKIKALFVPREGYAAEFVADITATYQGRMGLLTYPFTVLADFVGTVATLEEQEPVLRWDAVEWQNKTIISAGEYNLKSAVSSAQMQTVYMIYKTVVSGVLVVAFLHLCYKKLKEVQHN